MKIDREPEPTETPTATPTPTETPDDRAAISFVLLCVDENLDVPEDSIGGNGADSCPDPDTVPLVRYQWTGATFEAEGPTYNTTLTATAFKDNNASEPVEAEWTSTTYDIQGAVVGAGGNVCEFDDPNDDGVPDTGTVESCGPGGNQPNVAVQSGSSGPSSSSPVPLPLWGLAAVSVTGLLVHRRW